MNSPKTVSSRKPRVNPTEVIEEGEPVGGLVIGLHLTPEGYVIRTYDVKDHKANLVEESLPQSRNLAFEDLKKLVLDKFWRNL